MCVGRKKDRIEKQNQNSNKPAKKTKKWNKASANRRQISGILVNTYKKNSIFLYE